MLCVQRPVTLESVKYAWEHDLREKVRIIRENERLQGLIAHYESLSTGTRHDMVPMFRVSMSSRDTNQREIIELDETQKMILQKAVRIKVFVGLERTIGLSGLPNFMGSLSTPSRRLVK